MLDSLLNTSKLALSSRAADGFTLTELLVAGALTATVVGISGVGLASMLSSSSDSGVQNERRIELNRSLDFIAAEVRQAERIEPNADRDLAADAPSFDTTNKVPVLTLTIPDVGQRVVYYLAAANAPWQGPQAIYRWGPDFDINGSYINPDTPSTWHSTPQPLIDLISDEGSGLTVDADADCQATGWRANPPNPTGFYSCVSPTGKIAKIFHKGHLKKVLGNSESYALETKVFARNTSIDFGGSGGPSPFFRRRSRVTISNLGGAIQCGAGPRVDYGVSGTVEFDPGSVSGSPKEIMALPGPGQEIVDHLVEPNTALTVVGQIRGTCIRDILVNSSIPGTQVLVLRNGQAVPPFRAYRDQNEIAAFLTANNPKTNRPYLDPDTRRISLTEYQVLFLFELGVNYDSSKGPGGQDEAFDMQDLVVVVTERPDEE